MYGRAVLMRARLRQARIEDDQLKANDRSDSFDDNQKVLAGRRRITEEAPGCDWPGADWDHSSAQWHLRQSEANRGAFSVDGNRLLVAATLASAELQVPRSFDATLVADYLLKIPAAAHAQITKWWRGR